MNLIKGSIDRPVAVIAAVLMVIMFGIVALQYIPIQLAPDVNRPVITVTTSWPGAAPVDVEREILNRQEEELRGLEGLKDILGRAETGRARVTLEFGVAQDMDKALLLVANRLDRVNGYPAEASEPTLDTSGSEDNAIAWLILRRKAGNERPMETYNDFAEDFIKERIERVNGISNVRIYGGAKREVRITIDPERLATYRLSVPAVIAELRNANASVSAGAIEEGKRRYVVRTDGDLKNLDVIRDIVLRSDQDPVSGRLTRVTLADIANVSFDYKEATSTIRINGERGLAHPVYRETGANVIETMAGVRAAIAEINRDFLEAEDLYLTQVYDETTYINSAIQLVQQNIWLGGSLAAIVLLIFLRSGGATLVVSLAIPVSVIGSFVAMAALGRSINVVSLAGLAFAVGMVVDAAIVVLENIYRLRQRGLSSRDAAFKGTQQVWGAVLVSALTTVMVFIPILIMQLEIGQLFRDIAVAISVSVLLSLVVSVTVIPALASRLLGGDEEDMAKRRHIPGIDQFATGFVAITMSITRAVVDRKSLAVAAIVALTGFSCLITVVMLPKLDYLPNGNRNLVIGWLLPPPGYNLDTMSGIAGKIEAATRPLWSGPDGPSETASGQAMMERFFFVAFRANVIVGSAAVDPSRASELIPPLRQAAFSEPGTFGFFNQTSLFGRGIGGSRAIDLDISGGDLPTIIGIAQRAFGMTRSALKEYGNAQIRPRPGLSLGAPEVRVIPDRVKLADNGISARDLGVTIDTFNDGVRIAEITVDGERVDLTLSSPGTNRDETQNIANLPIVTADGRIIPVGSLARVDVTSGPTEIRHRDRTRTITLVVQPPKSMPLETAMQAINDDVIKPITASGLPAGVKLRMSGTADKLTETWQVMVFDLGMAVIIVYLVMAVLFESFLYPLIVLVSVPLATAGGVLGVGVLNFYYPQNLDMLTLLGFVILIGIVVNNAILLVYQTLHHLRNDGMTPENAIIEATNNRIRPIFMSTLTSVLGMLPLVVFPGAGSELYRGLGSVVIGGLSLSAVLTLGLIPPLLSLFLAPIENRRLRRLAKDPSAVQA
jgi:HAE1 family hydrophobic/amphiphilic exporter-1